MRETDRATQALFADVQWVKVSDRLFAAKERLPREGSKSAQAKWQKEIEQARILSERGHMVYLVPESGQGKHYDALVDGRKTEMKTVTGSIGSVGKNFSRALKQGKDVFLRIKTPESAKRVYSKLVGSAKVMLENGVAIEQDASVYVWLDAEGVLRMWGADKIVSAARGMQQET